jgi:Fungal N-terminal domain of STAND proteins
LLGGDDKVSEKPGRRVLKSVSRVAVASDGEINMADPLSITASLLGITTAALQSAKSLYEAIKRFRDRDKTLRRLQNEVEDVTNILASLKEVISADQSITALLEGPVERCGQLCCEFERSMKKFRERSKTGFLDWAKMEFMRGDMNDFIDTVAGYKSTIAVSLGTITMSVPIFCLRRDLLTSFHIAFFQNLPSGFARIQRDGTRHSL